jgi:hypothetical protein
MELKPEEGRQALIQSEKLKKGGIETITQHPISICAFTERNVCSGLLVGGRSN